MRVFVKRGQPGATLGSVPLEQGLVTVVDGFDGQRMVAIGLLDLLPEGAKTARCSEASCRLEFVDVIAVRRHVERSHNPNRPRIRDAEEPAS